MGLVFSSTVGFGPDEVFAWHARPGAVTRLTPPWQPVRVRHEAESLRNGSAVLGLPGGLSWVATHQPEGYDPPRRFVDQLTSQPLVSALSWRHSHEFTGEAPDATRVTDTVETPVPAALLRAMFAYRHRQLAGDLASHARAQTWRAQPRTVAMTGSRGFVGSALSAFLSTGGHRVIRLVRRRGRHPDERQWQPDNPDPELLRDVDAVIHLAGEPIAGRFTDAHKAAVRDSRIGPTRRLAQLAAATTGVEVFVSASAIGFYGADRGDDPVDETSSQGDGFLADVVAEWEAATAPATEAGIRSVQVRTGIVQSPAGGTLRLLFPLFETGVGGRLGHGRQWQSWISLDDLLDVYLRALCDRELVGPVNAVAPNPVRNSEYTQTLAAVLHRPALIPVPSLGPRMLLGEQGAAELALANQRVLPRRLQHLDHQYRHPGLREALTHVVGASNSPE